VPEAVILQRSNLLLFRLFDHLVRDGQQPRRDLDAERSRRLKVDDELEFGQLQRRQIGGPSCTDLDFHNIHIS
jgi:hypothetical protein